MEELTLKQRLISLIKIISNSSFFISLLVIFVFTMIVILINSKVKKKYIKVLLFMIYGCLLTYIFIAYGKSIIGIGDNFISKIFTILYFPNLISYICMIGIAILLLLKSMLSEKITNFKKYSNIACFLGLSFLLILILDVIVKNKINVYNNASIYSNQDLTILIQASTYIFFIWCIFLFVDFISNIIIEKLNKKKAENIINTTEKELFETYNPEIEKAYEMPIIQQNKTIEKPKKLTKAEKKKLKAEQEEIAKQSTIAEFSVLSDKDFYKSFHIYNKKRVYEDYMNISKGM